MNGGEEDGQWWNVVSVEEERKMELDIPLAIINFAFLSIAFFL